MQEENDLLQDLHPDIAINVNDTNLSSWDHSFFIRDGDQILLSASATKRISTLVQRANKHRQLPNVEGEDLGWILKKLEKNVRKGWMSIPMDNQFSDVDFISRHLDELDVPTLEHGIECALSIFAILTSTRLDKKVRRHTGSRALIFCV
jgi:hypothetical protein